MYFSIYPFSLISLLGNCSTNKSEFSLICLMSCNIKDIKKTMSSYTISHDFVIFSAMQQTFSTVSFQQSASTCILLENEISFSSLGKSDY